MNKKPKFKKGDIVLIQKRLESEIIDFEFNEKYNVFIYSFKDQNGLISKSAEYEIQKI